MDSSIERPAKVMQFSQSYMPLSYSLEYKPKLFELSEELQNALDLLANKILDEFDQKDLMCEATDISMEELENAISPTLHCLLMSIICSKYRREKNETLHHIYQTKKANLTEEDKDLDCAYMKKYHSAVLLCAQIHGSYSQKKFTAYKQMNTILLHVA